MSSNVVPFPVVPRLTTLPHEHGIVATSIMDWLKAYVPRDTLRVRYDAWLKQWAADAESEVGLDYVIEELTRQRDAAIEKKESK